MLLMIPLDTVNWIVIGILKGLGKIKVLPFLQLFFYYAIQ